MYKNIYLLKSGNLTAGRQSMASIGKMFKEKGPASAGNMPQNGWENQNKSGRLIEPRLSAEVIETMITIWQQISAGG